ncbi:amino acid adenylation domain-containing protein [Nocardia sp. NPDC058640]|uniref:amino acid adenylation domain-containing protein n=1 Tax=Nocardia sp. NPDC058640 TaxID=3346571 RepID=UPI00365B346C
MSTPNQAAYAAEPIAIIGTGCRYGGGVNTIDAMWRFMVDGADATVALPTNRGWDIARLIGDARRRGTVATEFGSFLADADAFDADFFGISPREALAMDPQQRLLLETSWEAIEGAGVSADALVGSDTGVYFGVIQQEYGPRLADLELCRGYLDTGTTASVASGRVAYALGLRGPALSIDTACSSSLVAIHTAAQALRAGECNLALAGGATVHASPSIMVGFSLMRVLADDGRTRPFSAGAAGFGLGEGAGVVLMARLSDAIRDRRPVLAVLRGSAVVSDGASATLTMPSQAAQETAIARALRGAGLTAADIDAVEAHGTGTVTGDPIEIAALARAYGVHREPGHPLLIGSLKGNFGHTQAASGVAGVIKMVESIRRGMLPPTAHFRQGSAITHPDSLRVLDTVTPWPSGANPRRGGVSANGISGVNCHLILEQAPSALPSPGIGRPVPIVVTGKTDAAMRANAARLAAHLRAKPDVAPTDVAHTMTFGRSQFQHRAVVVGRDTVQLAQRLDLIADDVLGQQATMPRTSGAVLVFPGQGSQWASMAQELLATSPIFYDAVKECSNAFAEFLDWSVLDVLREQPDAADLDRVEVTQPVLFTVMVGLARVWESLGVTPSAVIGHSQGEVAAAHIAGILDLRDATMTIARRGAVMSAITGRGAMVSLPLSLTAATALVTPYGLGIACVNGPESTVVSGSSAAIEALLAECADKHIDARVVPVPMPSHSTHVDELIDPIRAALASLSPRDSTITYFSPVTGNAVAGSDLVADYWFANARQTVRFDLAVAAAYRAGHRVFIEVSPHPVLAAGINEIINADADAEPVLAIGTLKRDHGGIDKMLLSAAELYRAGVDIDWADYLTHCGGSAVILPTYPFDRKRFWMMPDDGVARLNVRSWDGSSRHVPAAEYTVVERPSDHTTLNQVRSVVAQILGYTPAATLDVDRSFKSLGVDSLAAVNIRTRLRAALGVEVRVRDMSEYPTPTALATYLDSANANPVHHVGKANAAPTPQDWPLMPYQTDLVAAGALLPDRPVVQSLQHLRIIGATDVDRLASGIRDLYRRHDALRIELTDTVAPRQRLRTVPEHIEFVDFTDHPHPRAAFAAWIGDLAEAALPADGPLTEFAIARDRSDSLVVVLRFHHAALDGWSVSLVVSELIGGYFGTTHGLTPTTSYLAAIDDWQAYRESAAYHSDLEALTTRFAALSPALFTRKTLAPRSAIGRHNLRLSANDVAPTLRAGSLVARVVTAIGVYLNRVHPVGDSIVGVTLLNRDSAATLTTVGEFANILPVHIALASFATVGDLVDDVAHQLHDLQDRQRLPYGDLARAVRTASPETTALFDVRLTYNKFPTDQHFAAIRDDVTTVTAGYAMDAVNIIVNEYAYDGTVDVDVFYAGDVFDTHLSITDAVGAVLSTIATTISTPHAPVTVLGAPNRRDTHALNMFEQGTVVGLAPNDTLASLTDQAVRTYSERTALRTMSAAGEPEQCSYAEFGRRVHNLAATLQEKGVAAGEFVVVVLRRTAELVVAVHAVQAAGCAYVPISPDYPVARIKQLITDSGARFVITDAALVTDVNEIAEVVSPSPTRDRAHLPSVAVEPDDLAYMIYTSGTTGRPKGVMVEHRAAVNRLQWMQRRYQLTRDDVVLHKTPFTFDVSVWELIWPLHAGAQMSILPDNAHTDPRKIVDTIARDGVTVLHFVPSMFDAFLDEVARHRTPILRSLRLIVCSGEALQAASVRRFGELFSQLGLGKTLLANLYGPTEATVDVSSFEVTADMATSIDVVPIGTPIDNIELLVLDRTGRRAPLGAPGELNIVGVGLARGYHERPIESAAAFVDDDTVAGGRRYRTGDWVRWRADGNLEYLGRFDDQVKIRGNRIALGEVRAVLAAAPDVSAAAVFNEPNANGDNGLVGYYRGSANTAAVEQFLRDRLPAFAIPVLVPVTSIPVTHNGKADRAALSRLRRDLPPLRQMTAPTTETEVLLADAWHEVMGARPSDLDTDFFGAGGDSLQILRLRAAIESRHLSIDLEQLADQPTIRHWARLVEHQTVTAPAAALPTRLGLVPITDRAILAHSEDAFPASSMQLGMLYHALQERHSSKYKDVFRYQLTMPWKPEAFAEATESITARHPALRSSFDLVSYSQPVQIVRRQVPTPLVIVDELVDDHAETMRTYPYDITAAPLWRLRVCPGAGDAVSITFSFHHAILDGWSAATVISELLQTYLYEIGQVPAPSDLTPSPTTPLSEFVRAQQDCIADGAAQRYWRSYLTGAVPSRLESALAHEPVRATGTTTTTATLPRWFADGLFAVTAQRGIPAKSVLLTAHCWAMGHLTGTDELVTGMVTHARPAMPGIESVAGMFLNTVPVRFTRSVTTWDQAVHQVRTAEATARPHRRYPLQAILDQHGDLFDTAFNYVNYRQVSELLDTDAITLDAFTAYEETSFALMVTAAVHPASHQLQLNLGAAPNGVTERQRHDYVRAFTHALGTILREPGCAPTNFATTNVMERFDHACALFPDAVALADDHGNWTYADLAAHVDQARLQLHRRGVQRGHRIALRMSRSREQIAVLLATLRAGAAAVPIDPDSPQSRSTAMLAIAGPEFIIDDHDGHALITPTTDHHDSSLPPALSPSDLAYVLFTSGSTGEPKGVAMHHHGLANLESTQRNSTGVGRCTAQLAPLTFDVSFQEIFSTLCSGATLRLMSTQQRTDPRQLLRVLTSEQVDRVFLPFVALQSLAAAAKATQTYPVGLMTIVSSGEQLRITDEIRELCAANPAVTLDNQYGPTETHVALSNLLHGCAAEYPTQPAIGQPIAGLDVHILDDQLRPVHANATGEIYLTGLGVARGYLNRPGLTAQRFLAAPRGTVMYRTGDLAVRSPEGDVRMVGRVDGQVKIRGFRVETAEVEAALAVSAPTATHHAVVTRAVPDGQTILEAFLAGTVAGTDLVSIQASLRAQLPHYMVPARIHVIDALPRTASGKRDDRRLRELAAADIAPAEAPTQPDSLTKRVAEAFTAAVGVGEFGPDTDFFAGGGNSIAALHIALSVQRQFGVEIGLDQFLVAPTPAHIAALISAKHSGVQPDSVSATLLREGTGHPLFLVHPIGGSIMPYVALAQRLPGERPVYGLQAPGFTPDSQPLDTVEALAENYVRAIRSVQPSGPYLLGGWSFGGYIVYEMARQLGAPEVSQLIMIDTIVADATADLPVTEPELIRWFFMDLMWGANPTTSDFLNSEDLSATTDPDALFTAIVAEATTAGLLPDRDAERIVQRMYAVFRAHVLAAARYTIQPTPIPIVLVKATDPLPATSRPCTEHWVATPTALPTVGAPSLHPSTQSKSPATTSP